MRSKLITPVIILAIVSAIAWKLTVNKKELNAKKAPVTVSLSIPVKVYSVREQAFDVSIVKTGTLAPFKETKVLSTISGPIVALKFKLGDKVRQGQVLAIIDEKLLELELRKAETLSAKLKNDLQTYTELYNGHAVTEEKLNEVRQNYNDAVNQVEQAMKQLTDAEVRSPTTGIISGKDVEQGVFVNAGAPLGTVVNASGIKVQVSLTEGEVYQIKAGQKVAITTDVYPNKVFTGHVSFISPQADATHSYPAEVMVDADPGHVLYSGTFVNVDFPRHTRLQLLVIPREALAESEERAMVYVIDQGVSRQRTIVPGRQIGDMVEIVSGLTRGEAIVVSGQINLNDGSAVSITK